MAAESEHTDQEGENLPNSQNWGIRSQAEVGNGLQKKHMKTSCNVCLKSNFLCSLISFCEYFLLLGKKKNEIWLKCGIRQCSRLNVHAKCSFIHVPNMDKERLAKFCTDHIR